MARGIIPRKILIVLHDAAPGHLRSVHDKNARCACGGQHSGRDPSAAANVRLRREDHGAEH